jgi:hypothetical protein
MRTRLLCAALLICASCVKRIAPMPGNSRTAAIGNAVTFGAPQELPEGTTIHWQFGDGSPEQTGAQVTHVFYRAGTFTVTETVVDKDGEKRSADLQAQITRRSVAAAIPADARSALILERPWARVEAQRAAANRVGLGELFSESDREYSDLFGFTASDPKAAEAAGVNTDEGIALYTVPQDLEALVACASIADSAKATQALQHLLAHEHGGPFALHEAKLADGTPVTVGERHNGAEKIGYLEKLGYLYLRVPGASDPLLALASAAAISPEAGLEKDAGYNAALSHVGQGDAFFYSAGRTGDALSSRFANELGASAFSVTVSADQVQIHAFGQPRTLIGKAFVDALTPSVAPPDFATQLPVGAAFYAKGSGNPALLWAELQKALGADGQTLRDSLREKFGTDVEKLMPAFTGNGSVALYLDAQSLIEALLGEQVASLDRSTFISVSELNGTHETELREALDKAAGGASPAHPTGEWRGSRVVHGSSYWKISDGLQVAIRGKLLFAAIGGAPELEGGAENDGKGGDKASAVVKKNPAKGAEKTSSARKPAPSAELTPAEIGPLAAVLLAPDNGTSLAVQLRDVKLPFTAPMSQLLWIDIRGTLERLQGAADSQGGVVGMGVRRLTDRVKGLRDALVDAHAEPDGFAATITLRFLP